MLGEENVQHHLQLTAWEGWRIYRCRAIYYISWANAMLFWREDAGGQPTYYLLRATSQAVCPT
jgi:hypothetical protein